jgi:hypothetical protein
MRRSSLIAPRASPAPALRTREHAVPFADTNDVMRRFNRQTGRLTTLVVGVAASVAFMLAVLVQDRHPTALDLSEEAMQAGDKLSHTANSGMLLTNVGLQGKISPDEITTGQARSVDHAFVETIPKKNPSEEATAPSPTSVLAPLPANGRPSLAVTLPSAAKIAPRAIRRKIRSAKYLSSLAPRSGGVKMRLIALWHQSFARAGKSQNWTGFSSLKGNFKKKVAYTAESNRLTAERH